MLWISGAPGSGKTTTGWSVFEQLTAAGANVAYVDIDQLGLFAPAGGESGNSAHTMKSYNALHVIECVRSHGVGQIVISGVIVPVLELNHFRDGLPAKTFELTHVRLRCDWEELKRRYLGRGSTSERLDELAEVAGIYEHTEADTVDTTNMSVQTVTSQLLTHCTIRRSPWGAPDRKPRRAASLPTTVLYGATAVGKSAAGWALVQDRWANGKRTAYIDVDQLGFHGPNYHRSVHTAVYTALTHGYQHAGAEELIAVTRDPHVVLQANHTEDLTTILLDADDETFITRIELRSHGNPARLAGDELLHADTAQQALASSRARGEAAHHRRSRLDDVTINTTDDTVPETARRIEKAIPTQQYG